MSPVTDVPAALRAVRRGEIAVVVDDEHRENEGDLIVAAEAATTDRMAFFVAHTSGLICVGLSGRRADELALPPMVVGNREAQRTAFTVSVDLARTHSTGISAHDRALTIQALVDPDRGPTDFARPGHVFPLRARDQGVLRRPGHTEAAVDLTRLAGLHEGGALCEVVTEDKRSMARAPELRALAARHGLPFVTIADLIHYRMRTEILVEYVASGRVPTRHGEFCCQTWRSLIDGTEHAVLSLGDLASPEPALTRMHSECLTGDVFGSERCDCGTQLDDALAIIAHEGRGVVVYLRGHEGRGIGLTHKLRAYALQDAGSDTVSANVDLGLPIDGRDYGVGAQILRGLGVERARLLTNNPDKCRALSDFGLEVTERVSLEPRVTGENISYLQAKRDRMGHLIPSGIDALPSS